MFHTILEGMYQDGEISEFQRYNYSLKDIAMSEIYDFAYLTILEKAPHE